MFKKDYEGLRMISGDNILFISKQNETITSRKFRERRCILDTHYECDNKPLFICMCGGTNQLKHFHTLFSNETEWVNYLYVGNIIRIKEQLVDLTEHPDALIPFVSAIINKLKPTKIYCFGSSASGWIILNLGKAISADVVVTTSFSDKFFDKQSTITKNRPKINMQGSSTTHVNLSSLMYIDVHQSFRYGINTSFSYNFFVNSIEHGYVYRINSASECVKKYVAYLLSIDIKDRQAILNGIPLFFNPIFLEDMVYKHFRLFNKNVFDCASKSCSIQWRNYVTNNIDGCASIAGCDDKV